jgi:hypothetical protein
VLKFSDQNKKAHINAFLAVIWAPEMCTEDNVFANVEEPM